ncbi:hypothetical protein [Microbulbifer discodermiae]|uniref:hypothetical protein n=1 Tax=Microbulbifer sp. 2201CG32-9 TaxID=3232309 RepID=UPI00345C509D
MTQLFGHKWVSQEGEPGNEREGYSPNFLLWAQKTAHLNDAAWKRGFDRLEFMVREAGRQGDEVWPPSYAAFLGMCEKPHGEMAHKLFKPLALPDKAAQERSRSIGSKTLGDLKSMFSED